ncbi:uncharacterized protein B0J16DRAFT_340473 [Fusarium flagelliforme]|uniref:uncharacterized protein n=1 Tax=Fusarium flagelliforme TaxID=2675880 RepID=UPI001E8EE174|nr:uncharacterized protein B0J16DRAFT_340473 [Fusarium flagelliforme]KAH7184794.1 hypothetical protein B0J16DRAFT_340473 [Fusarium flagelliforme]
MAQGAQSRQRGRYWLLTCPRTASNLLVKMLNLDEQGVRPANHGGYFFLPAIQKHFLVEQKPMDTWTEEEKAPIDEIIQQCSQAFQDHIAAAEAEGQKLYVKEHSIMLNHPRVEDHYINGSKEKRAITEATPVPVKGIAEPTRSKNNLTLFPDEFLKTWNPTFLIRHPALMIPSLYRTSLAKIDLKGISRPRREPCRTEVTMRWHRSLYEFYAEHFGNDSVWPIVLDADDIMLKPEIVCKYAKLAGLDESKVRRSWDKAPSEELNKLSHMEQRMLSSINASTAIDNSKVAGNIDIDQEVVKWTEEFGEGEAKKIEKWVRDVMPDYEYMHSKRMRLE